LAGLLCDPSARRVSGAAGGAGAAAAQLDVGSAGGASAVSARANARATCAEPPRGEKNSADTTRPRAAGLPASLPCHRRWSPAPCTGTILLPHPDPNGASNLVPRTSLVRQGFRSARFSEGRSARDTGHPEHAETVSPPALHRCRATASAELFVTSRSDVLLGPTPGRCGSSRQLARTARRGRGARRLPAPPGRSLRQCWEVIAPCFVDVHSHVVPSGDDGAVSVEEGLELCRAAANAGTRVLFATPHMHEPLDSYPWTPEREQRYEEAFAAMQPTVERMGLDLRRARGVPDRGVARRSRRASAGWDVRRLGRVPGVVARRRRRGRAHLGGVRANRRGRTRPGARPSGAVSRSCRRVGCRNAVGSSACAAEAAVASVWPSVGGCLCLFQ